MNISKVATASLMLLTLWPQTAIRAASVQVSTIALTGVDDSRGPGLGPGVVYALSGLGPVGHGPNGQFAFGGEISGGGIANALYRGSLGNLQRVASSGDSAGGIALGTFSFVGGAPSFLDNGALTHSVVLQGTGIGNTNDGAIYAVGGSAPLGREGDLPPSAANPFQTITTIPLSSAAGAYVVSVGRIQGPGTDATSDGVIWANHGSGLVQVVREGVGFAASGLNANEYYSAPTAPTLNPNGGVVFSAEILQSPANTSLGSGLFGWDGSTISKLLRTGDTVPSTTATLSFAATVGATHNKVGVFSQLNAGGEVTGSNDRTLHSYSQSGWRLLAREGEGLSGAPGFSAVQLGFSQNPIRFGGDDIVAFRVDSLNTPAASGVVGVFLDRGGVRTPVVVGGDTLLPGLLPGEQIRTFGTPQFTVSEHGAIAFSATIDRPLPSSDPNGIWYRASDGSYSYLLRDNDQLDVDPTPGVDLRQITNFQLGQFVDDHTFLAQVFFEGGSSGIFAFSVVPEPAIGGMFAALAVFLTLPRRSWSGRTH